MRDCKVEAAGWRTLVDVGWRETARLARVRRAPFAPESRLSFFASRLAILLSPSLSAHTSLTPTWLLAYQLGSSYTERRYLCAVFWSCGPGTFAPLHLLYVPVRSTRPTDNHGTPTSACARLCD
jgi:hypothetical protein